MSEANEPRADWRETILDDVATKWILGRSKPEKITAGILLVSLGISFNFRNHAVLKRRRGKFVMGKLGKMEVATVRVPPGTMQLESVLAVAARTSIRYCLGIGAVGAADADLEIGDTILPTEAFCGDGLTSYYPGDDVARPDAALLELARVEARRNALPVTEGGVYTTASLCMESDDLVERVRSQGYLGLDNQVAPFYRVARHYGLSPLALVTVSDSPPRREIYFKDRHLMKRYIQSQNAAFSVIEAMARQLDSPDRQRNRRRRARRRS